MGVPTTFGRDCSSEFRSGFEANEKVSYLFQNDLRLLMSCEERWFINRVNRNLSLRNLYTIMHCQAKIVANGTKLSLYFFHSTQSADNNFRHGSN